MRASVRLPSANRLLDDEGFSVVFCRTEWPYFENFLRESSVRWILTKLGIFVSGPPRANPSEAGGTRRIARILAQSEIKSTI